MDTRDLSAIGLACLLALAPCARAADAKPGAKPADAAPAAPSGKMVRLEAGQFPMGSDQPKAHWDERPVRTVKITRPLEIGETEVTAEEFKRFRPDFETSKGSEPYAAGMSWHDAVEYCQWLSKQEGVTYRLPTEAEWEFACRSGRLQNMLGGVREWCLDWYGEYAPGEQTDPVGPQTGWAKVVRGGLLDRPVPKPPSPEVTASNRGSVGPAFGYRAGDPNGFGKHPIGFRVVRGEPPQTRAHAVDPPLVSQAVAQSPVHLKQAPDPAKPYFRKRFLLPVPPDDVPREAMDAVGLHPMFQRHNHSPALTVCPNGDVLYVVYSSTREEREPELPLIASRLRFGADEWDFPSPFLDFADLNDHAPLLWTDGSIVRLFWGHPSCLSAFPFQWIESRDNGATWSEVHFPRFTAQAGKFTRQPISTAFRDASGTIYLPSDAVAASSVLWASKDHGATWFDTGGRTTGRHTVFATLKDGGIIGFGGKNSNVDGFMPMVMSADGGKTYTQTKTPFPPQANTQRPTVLRLQSGRLFFACDLQPKGGEPLPGQPRGAMAAVSDDDGKTWHVRRLPGILPHKVDGPSQPTIGYSASAQAPNGMIHLITSMNHPQALHFELNEAWVLAGGASLESDGSLAPDEQITRSAATQVAGAEQAEEKDGAGRVRLSRGGGVADDGRFLLHGPLVAHHPNGQKQWQAEFRLGRKVGLETCWSSDGTKLWERRHRDDGSHVWTQFWPSGKPRWESTWVDLKCHGEATSWDEAGQLVRQRRFVQGKLAE